MLLSASWLLNISLHYWFFGHVYFNQRKQLQSEMKFTKSNSSSVWNVGKMASLAILSIRALAVAHYSPDVASCGTDELMLLAKWQIKLLFTHSKTPPWVSQSIIRQMRLFNLWPWHEYYKSSMHPFHKRYGSAELPQGDARSQECADFRCGEWQPWWLSNCWSVVIETMFHSAGETWCSLKKAREPQQK